MENTSSGPPRKRSGFEIFLYVLLGIGGLLFAGAIAGAYFLFTTEKGQKIVRGVKEMGALTVEGMSAPGTEELRALGCENALVMTAGRIAEAAGRAGLDEMLNMPKAVEQDFRIVVCSIASSPGQGPDCSTVATVYGSAVDAPATFAVAVMNSRQSGGMECKGLFNPSGEKVGDLEPPGGEPSP